MFVETVELELKEKENGLIANVYVRRDALFRLGSDLGRLRGRRGGGGGCDDGDDGRRRRLRSRGRR